MVPWGKTNLTSTDFLDVTLDLGSSTDRSYCKPNDRLMYINTASHHPSIALKILVKGIISKRVMKVSSSQMVFDAAAPYYNEASAVSGFRDYISYMPNPNIYRRKCYRNIIWFK